MIKIVYNVLANNKHYTRFMINSITLEKVKEWDNLVDVDNTGEDVQALESYFID
jgi:hypothetical protein